ncbi:(2Fe-2S)-binding protein [Rubrimonas cliftonensis]|uniref:Nicotinate dehydrogenase subunit A n=1 Tax=Rubrimonas cliftonensis TaxID=89524 RepID=A0A1H4DLZ3_9RHOB|nr:(2Fe-2S)-binding protein [Rubrimonas cliftonensis]SEA73548.1 nicotinate dehydrogenase subunit A [Rubrimonas cliftonensis]
MSGGGRTTTLTLNGAEVAVEADPDAPLLHALRGSLGLTGARFGCGEGQCGACMVLVDGRATPSCDMPLYAAAGRSVETVEGLADHPLVAAIVEGQAGQCGYCLPGIVVAAKALLDRNPRPSRAEIAAALDGNLCRCGAHLRILKAVEAAAARMAEAAR